jgi:hypothetical protein
VWAVVLGILLASVVLVVVLERRRPSDLLPMPVSPLLLVVLAVIVGWLVAAIAV